MDALFLRLRGFYYDRNHYWTGNHAGRCLLHLVLLPRSWHNLVYQDLRHCLSLLWYRLRERQSTAVPFVTLAVGESLLCSGS